MGSNFMVYKLWLIVVDSMFLEKNLIFLVFLDVNVCLMVYVGGIFFLKF